MNGAEPPKTTFKFLYSNNYTFGEISGGQYHLYSTSASGTNLYKSNQQGVIASDAQFTTDGYLAALGTAINSAFGSLTKGDPVVQSWSPGQTVENFDKYNSI